MEMNKGRGLRNMKENEAEDVPRRQNYEKRLTVLVEIVGEDRITMMELLKKVREECGVVIGCRYKNPREYELTMNEDKGKDKILDGLRIKNSQIMAKEISNNEMVVSFLNLPTYIKDEEITRKLTDWGVTAVSTIRRRMWPGTDIADGTRFLKVKFTDVVKSLPYSTKFETLGGTEHFRVIHDRQVKVCRLCIQPGHIVRDCPNLKCFMCGKQGHYMRECNEGNCSMCRMRTAFCTCKVLEERKKEDSVGSSMDLYEEILTTEEEESEDAWNGRDSRDDVDPNREGMEGLKDGNRKSLKEQITEGIDRGTTKSGGKSEGGDSKNKQGTKLQEEGSLKEKGSGREEVLVVLETPLINLEEEMDTNEGNIKLLKRKMKGDEESIAKK
ncbi:Gag polyprotein [Labeo rohita]|uniref:Gag polyprotein n=1 Tax=Labeo rohita TaxID=84645 RepID=A0ABQ8L1M7_LABRO|nr:Gag polyprotein [Labeo rohita]